MEGNSLKVGCSPGTLNRIRNDEEFMRQKACEVLEEEFRTHGTSFDEVIFEENVPEEQTHATPENVELPSEMVISSFEDSQDFTPIEPKLVWLEAPTKLMLSLLEELRPKVGKSAELCNKRKMWKIIEERLKTEGYPFSALQIENKFRGMERQYKKVVLNNRQSGRSRQTCPYQSELDAILSEKRSINPTFLWESSEDPEMSRMETTSSEVVPDLQAGTSDDTPSCSTSRQKITSQKRNETLVEMAEERKEYHAKVLEYLKRKEERDIEKAERDKRKIELLEILARKK